MKVIFVKNEPKIAKAGEIKIVPPGFARNFLIPQGIAIPHTVEAEQRLRAMATRKSRATKQSEENSQRVRQMIRQKAFVIHARANETGRLFAQIHPKDIALVLAEAGISLKKESILIPEPIKSLGNFFAWYVFASGEREKILLEILSPK